MPDTTTESPRRSGRPTSEQAAQLDHDVREHALLLFLENGYEGASMDAIAKAAGTTKVSMYARFPSKDALFRSVLTWAVGRPDWPIPEGPPPPFDDLENALRTIAHTAMRRALDPAMVQLSRIAISQAARFPDVARTIQNVIAWPRVQLLSDLLRHHAELGTIDAPDPDVLAQHFLALVAGAPARLASFGLVRPPEVQEHHLDVAVEVFLRGVLHR
jgi:AcrR family transcriptional regulator